MSGFSFQNFGSFDDETGDLNVIIETPKGSRNKFNFDPERGVFKLGGVLPAGAVFPFDFGFVPDTLGEDGDPLDVLLLMDEPAFAGCLVSCRLVGVIEANQTERDQETMRNDRLIAVASNSYTHRHIRELQDLSDNLLEEIEHFFVSYNEIKGKKFEPLHRRGANAALQVVRRGEKMSLTSEKPS
jgi:inorganic pyrophosphatase